MKAVIDRSAKGTERKNNRIDKRVASLNKRSGRILDKASSTNTLVMNGMTANLKTVDRSKLSERENARVNNLKSRARSLSSKKVLTPEEAFSLGVPMKNREPNASSRKDRRDYKSVMKDSAKKTKGGGVKTIRAKF